MSIQPRVNCDEVDSIYSSFRPLAVGGKKLDCGFYPEGPSHKLINILG